MDRKRANLKVARQKAGMTQQQMVDRLDSNMKYAITCSGKLTVCENGMVYKKYKDGLWRHLPGHYVMGNYLQVAVTENSITKTYLIHRLVAKEFVPNPFPNEYLEVNHINGVPDDNRACNLEWCNRQQNINHQKNLHAEKFRTKLKISRIERGITTKKLSREIGILLGRYRDIENAVRQPTKEESIKLENYFGENINILLAEVVERCPV